MGWRGGKRDVKDVVRMVTDGEGKRGGEVDKIDTVGEEGWGEITGT